MKKHSIASLEQGGFTLIEILVAVLVLSVGLLGMAALMVTSLRNTHSANQRTQAVNLAYEMIDAIRANLANATRYQVSAYSNSATICPAGTPKAPTTYPSASSPHTLELTRWLSDVCQALPNGRGQVLIARQNPVVVQGQTFATFGVTVNICWFDDRGSTATADCDNATAGPDTVISVASSL